MASRASRLLRTVPEWLRYAAERVLVLPAAAFLPRRWAFRVADATARVESWLPVAGTRMARAEMRAAGFAGQQLDAAVREHLAWPRRNLVYARRLRRGREHTRDWRVVETGGEAVAALRANRVPLLIVGAHFPEAAGLAVNTVIFPELAGRGVAQATPAFSLSPFVLRTRLVNGLTYGLSRSLVEPGRQKSIPRVGAHGVFAATVAALQGDVRLAKILADAFWEKEGAYRRPFAGMRKRGFALGTARIARAAQCHVVTYASTFSDPDTVQVEWGAPHPPPAPDDEAGDEAFTSAIIDEIERMVGRHPVQYVHPIGTSRRWDAAAERWS